MVCRGGGADTSPRHRSLPTNTLLTACRLPHHLPLSKSSSGHDTEDGHPDWCVECQLDRYGDIAHFGPIVAEQTVRISGFGST
jgi:hypothetical protein